MAKHSFSWVLKFVLAIVFYIVVNKYVVWHLQLFVGKYLDSNFLFLMYWILSLITLIMVIPMPKKAMSFQVALKFVGRRFLEVLIYLTITYIAIDLLYFICDILSFEKRNLVEYVSGITLFVVIGVVMFSNLNLSYTLLRKCNLSNY